MTESIPRQPKPESVGLPPRFFLYTLDQIAEMIQVDLAGLRARYVYFDGRSIGALKRDKILAKNIAPLGETPAWRVAEPELVRWLRFKRFRFHTRGWVDS